MPRKNRFDYLHDDCIVHVRLQINNGEYLFDDNTDYQLWREWMLFYLQKHPTVKLTGYQWMNNHCHLILYSKTAAGLVRFLHNINWRFAYEFNKRHGRKGHLFQNRYRCTVIDKDNYEMVAQRYIYRNQVRAGMVAQVRHNRWGSYHYYAYGKADALITPFFNFPNFGRDIQKRRYAFRIFVESMTDREEAALRKAFRSSGLIREKWNQDISERSPDSG